MEPHREPIKEWWENWETVGTRLRKFVSDRKHTTRGEVVNQDLNLKGKVMKVGASTAGKVKRSCLRISETRTELYRGISLIWKLQISDCLVGTFVLLGTGRKPWCNWFMTCLPSFHSHLTIQHSFPFSLQQSTPIRENLNRCNLFLAEFLPPLSPFNTYFPRTNI